MQAGGESEGSNPVSECIRTTETKSESGHCLPQKLLRIVSLMPFRPKVRLRAESFVIMNKIYRKTRQDGACTGRTVVMSQIACSEWHVFRALVCVCCQRQSLRSEVTQRCLCHQVVLLVTKNVFPSVNQLLSACARFGKCSH